jgi:hypothetical protein
MPLVFVHGVSNRWSGEYERGVATRDAFFRRFLLREHQPSGSEPVSIRNPYWGGHGGRLRWGGASLPLEDFESLGSEDAAFVALQAAADPDGLVDSPSMALLTVARRSLAEAVDLAWSAAALAEAGEAEALAELGEHAVAYTQRHPRPAWIDEVRTDQELLTRLQQELVLTPGRRGEEPVEAAGYESLGLADGWNAVRRGASRLRAAATGLVGRSAAERIRPAAVPPLVSFLGDVFVYLHEQAAVARPIGEIVEADLRAAAEQRTDADPLVVVAHSMGGVITYDLLTSAAKDLRVDLLVTAGTQVGFFEELKLFSSSDPSIPDGDDARVPLPAAIRLWINIFDYNDLLGFQCSSIINGVSDFAYRTGSLLKAHSQYFLQPGFHERLARRVSGVPT